MFPERFPQPEAPDTPRFSAALEHMLREKVASPPAARRRAPRRAAAVLVATMAVAAIVTATTNGPGESGVAHANAMVLQDGRVVPFSELYDPGLVAALRKRLAGSGVRLVVRERPVGLAAVGDVLSVQFPDGATFDEQHRLRITPDLHGTLEVVIGRGATGAERRAAGAKGLPFDPTTDLCRLVDVNNASASATALREHGYTVVFNLVRFEGDATSGRLVDSRTVLVAPADTAVLSVLDMRGYQVKRTTRALQLEIAAKHAPAVSSGGEPLGQGLTC
jgi:hypothetical protein